MLTASCRKDLLEDHMCCAAATKKPRLKFRAAVEFGKARTNIKKTFLLRMVRGRMDEGDQPEKKAEKIIKVKDRDSELRSLQDKMKLQQGEKHRLFQQLKIVLQEEQKKRVAQQLEEQKKRFPCVVCC